jgi:pyruvate formate lyase activating enzyme
MMGRDYEMEGTQSPEAEFMEELKAIVEEEGLTCKIGG